MNNMRWFPIALYVYMGGAAGLGFSAGLGVNEPDFTTLAIAAVSFLFWLVGWWMMRPYLKQAKAVIKQLGMSRFNQAEVEEKVNDARS